MDCSYCGKPVTHALLITQDVQGVGPQRKDSCFSCVSKIAENEMRLSQRAVCPTCGNTGASVGIAADSKFTFTCSVGHSWSI